MPKRVQDWSPKDGKGLWMPRQISDAEDVRRFFRWLLWAQDLNFHPDNNFNDYIEYKTGERVYSKRDAERLNTLMRQAFRAVPDVYQIAMEESELFDRGSRFL